ncbi:putative transcriptional regulatory protein TcrX [Aquisphaera giovannonii]|uniref:Putative transcriptional regulatory protein TcrX n=1 Tax=Aquisphaera giovannonii TaxID=406548 RepID=A0A5B9WCM1_9BACT|nr:response regulator [Aquisphaera giovannonii]QEH37979.1 putative transcriptional regulatory protein TcrX [Aquisphaera giovannonii]
MPTALIVEDEPEANKLLGMLVRLRGFQIRSAFTGKEALRQVEAARPDVVFLDLMLPDLNGYEICRALKSDKETSLLPLIIVTARIADENRVESFCLGADDYVSKPYTPDHIFQALERAGRWDALCHQEVVRGEIPFGRHDEAETLRRLGQLRSVTFARSPLALRQVHEINDAIKLAWCTAFECIDDRPGEPCLVLSYTLDRDRLELRFRSQETCIRRIAGLAQDPASSIYLAAFDRVAVDDASASATLTKSFPHD